MNNIDREPTNIIGISLLHKCNFNCEHCGYIYIGDTEDHIIKPGYKLSWDQVKTVIDDCCTIDNSYWNMNYTGGEPTLWSDKDKSFVDILIATGLAGQSPSYNTNGSYFDDYARCHEFFIKYMESTKSPLATFISMDKFHKNYDEKKGRAKSLDNIVRVMEEIPEDRKAQFKTHVITIVTKYPDSTLPEGMKAHYGEHGITFGDFPMMGIGKAKNISDQIPDVAEYFTPVQTGSGGPRVIVLVGDDYYVGSSKTGKLGHLTDMYPSPAGV